MQSQRWDLRCERQRITPWNDLVCAVIKIGTRKPRPFREAAYNNDHYAVAAKVNGRLLREIF
jgi:hypothetical protein